MVEFRCGYCGRVADGTPGTAAKCTACGKDMVEIGKSRTIVLGTLNFEGTEMRDDFMSRFFPMRAALDSPGSFYLGGDYYGGVFCDRFTLYHTKPVTTAKELLLSYGMEGAGREISPGIWEYELLFGDEGEAKPFIDNLKRLKVKATVNANYKFPDGDWRGTQVVVRLTEEI